ncbi:hypothetical protein CBL_20727, partial [Carabus blaptoides fortunei]
EIVLRNLDLMEIVSGTTRKPVINGDQTDTHVKAWIKKDNEAQNGLSRRLEAVHGRSSEAAVNTAMQKFYGLKYDGDSIAKHIAKVEELAHQLNTMGEKITNNMMINKILSTLPPSFDHFHSAWDSTQEKTMESLLTRLLLEEERINSRNKDESVESNALVARKFDNRDILNKIAGIKKGKDESKSESKHALIAIEGKIRKDDWILDSGASDHMSYKADWFEQDTFTYFEKPRKVKVGNNDFIEALGEGNIEIKAFNGATWKSATIKKVLYVPDIANNLFSEGAALDKGLKYESDKDECTFYKNETVVATALYVDDGLIVASSESDIQKLLSHLQEKYELTINKPSQLLGMTINREADGSIYIHQEAYAQAVLKRFGMTDANPVSTPAEIADANSLSAKKVPQTRAGACFAACLAKGIGLIVDNEINVRYTRQRGLSSRLETIMRLCSYPLTDEDKCAAVKEALTCIKKSAIHLKGRRTDQNFENTVTVATDVANQLDIDPGFPEIRRR